MPERDAEAIKRDIENARVTLARSVDQLVYRTSPKRVVENTKTTLKQKAQTQQGKAVIAGAGLVFVLLIVRRVRNR